MDVWVCVVFERDRVIESEKESERGWEMRDYSERSVSEWERAGMQNVLLGCFLLVFLCSELTKKVKHYNYKREPAHCDY